MNLEIREIKIKDVQTMMNWGVFEDPRYLHFNFPYKKSRDFEIWYRYKVNAFRVKTYGAFLGTRLIGFISYKNINYLFSRAELGVIFDINYTSKGYGSMAIEEVLKKARVKKVYLYVSTFNTRAYNAYEKLGFKSVKIVYRIFENQSIIDKIRDDDMDFLKKNGILYGKYIKMEKYL